MAVIVFLCKAIVQYMRTTTGKCMSLPAGNVVSDVTFNDYIQVLVKVPARVLYGNYWARRKFEKVM